MIFAGWTFGAPFNGWLSDHTKTRKLPLFIGGVLAIIFISCIIFKPINLSLPTLSILLFLFGFCVSSQVICFVVNRENNPTHIAATAIASTNLLVMLGGIIFQPLVGHLLDIDWHGQIHNGIRIYSGANYQHALALVPICILIGTILTLFLRETYSHIDKDWDEFDFDQN